MKVTKARFDVGIVFVSAVIIIMFGGMPGRAEAYIHPGGFHTIEQLNYTRSQLKSGVEPWRSAYDKLLWEADAALHRSPSAIEDFDNPDPGIDRAGWDAMRSRLDGDASAAYLTALAYALDVNLTSEQREQYGRKAITLMNDWAYVNKHISGVDGALNAAQSAPLLIVAAELMFHSPLWRAEDKAQFIRWAKNVLYAYACDISFPGVYELWPSLPATSPELWLINHNHGGWFAFCALTVNHLMENHARMLRDIERLQIMMDVQIAPDGSLTNELVRGEKARYYSYFSLKAMTAAVEVARNVGVDLYDLALPAGGSLRKALEWYWKVGVADPSAFPVANQNFLADPATDGGIFFYPMSQIYSVPEWRNWVGSHIPYGEGGNTSWVLPSLMQPLPR